MLFIGSSRVQLPLRQTECQRKPLHDGLFPGSVWMVGQPYLTRITEGLPVIRSESMPSANHFLLGLLVTNVISISASGNRETHPLR
jgi:hypothetical protein